MNNTFKNSTDNLNKLDASILFISLHAFNFLLGLPLNTYIIVLLFPCRGVLEPSNVFPLNQAIAEMFFAFSGLFRSLCNISLDLCSYEGLGFFLGTNLASRSMFQCCVCLERYLAVVHPVTFLKHKEARYRVAFSVLIWIFSFAIGIICLFMKRKSPFRLYAALYIIILTADIFCCTSILKRLRHPGPRDMESDTREMNSAKKKAFLVISINLQIFLIQNIPIAVAFGIEQTVSEYVFNMALMTGLVFNTVIGFLKPLYILYRAGKLSSVRTFCCPALLPSVVLHLSQQSQLSMAFR